MKINIDTSKIKTFTKDVGTVIGFVGGLITVGIILSSDYTDFLRYTKSINNTNNMNNTNMDNNNNMNNNNNSFFEDINEFLNNFNQKM